MSALEKVSRYASSAGLIPLTDQRAREPGLTPLGELVQAAGTSLAQARTLLLSADLSALPPEVAQAARLSLAAAGCVTTLADQVGVSLADSGWVAATACDSVALRLAGDSDGDGGTSQGAGETYADPGLQKDGKKRYPVTKDGKLNAVRIRAAWAYINQDGNADDYSAADLAKIKAKIQSAAKSAGIEIDDDSDSGSSSSKS